MKLTTGYAVVFRILRYGGELKIFTLKGVYKTLKEAKEVLQKTKGSSIMLPEICKVKNVKTEIYQGETLYFHYGDLKGTCTCKGDVIYDTDSFAYGASIVAGSLMRPRVAKGKFAGLTKDKRGNEELAHNHLVLKNRADEFVGVI